MPDFFFQYWLKSSLVICTHKAQIKSPPPPFICAYRAHQMQHLHIPQGSTKVYNWHIFYVGFIRPLVLWAANCMLTIVNVRFQRASSCVKHRRIHISCHKRAYLHIQYNLAVSDLQSYFLHALSSFLHLSHHFQTHRVSGLYSWDDQPSLMGDVKYIHWPEYDISAEQTSLCTSVQK